MMMKCHWLWNPFVREKKTLKEGQIDAVIDELNEVVG